MEEHLSFDELQSFVFAEKLTPTILQLGAKINSHILSCDECAAHYNALFELRNQLEEKAQQVDKRLEHNTGGLEEQRSLIESIMSGSKEGERLREREGYSQKPGLSHSR